MSGGVDSAVAAARAVDAGHDVVGVHLALSRMPGTLRTGSRGCCTIEDSMDAQRAANIIGIPYYVWDFSERFKLDVVDDFIAEYSAGRTPNPCMRCNERIKFAALLEKALDLGFDAVVHRPLRRDRDRRRRQPRTAPRERLGERPVLRARRAHRRAARARDVPAGRDARRRPRCVPRPRRAASASRTSPTRHDICFIPDGDTRGWLAERVGAETGRHPRPRRATVSAPTRARTRSPSASARASTSASPPTTASRGSCSRCARRTTRSSSGRRRRSTSPRSPAPGSPGPGSRPRTPETPFACEVQIRAHADPVPAVGRRCARTRTAPTELVVTPDDPAQRRRARPDRRRLRRHPRARPDARSTARSARFPSAERPSAASVVTPGVGGCPYAGSVVNDRADDPDAGHGPRPSS